MLESAAPQTKAIIEVEGETIEQCTSFCYQNDMLSIGDPFAVTVANPRGSLRLRAGQKITLRLSNSAVNNGRAALKHTGRIIGVEYISDGAGTRVQLNCADLGWHLAQSAPPIEANIQRGTFGDLFGEPFINRSWGFPGDFSGPQGSWKAKLRTDSAASRSLRIGITDVFSKSQAAATNLAGIFQRVYVVQTEPGDTVADILTEYSRRFNLLLGVGADGRIQLWQPDYTQKPWYRIEYHDDENRERNNILGIRIRETIESIYTEVTCVGEIVGMEYAKVAADDPTPGRTRGFYRPDPAPLPFVHRRTFCDGEMFSDELALKQAEWHYKRGLFDAFSIEVRVPGHHQDGVWWEADTMCSVDDSIHGVTGCFYVQSVRYERTREGDVTDVVLRLPILTAAFGQLPTAPNVAFNPNLASAVKPNP